MHVLFESFRLMRGVTDSGLLHASTTICLASTSASLCIEKVQHTPHVPSLTIFDPSDGPALSSVVKRFDLVNRSGYSRHWESLTITGHEIDM